MASEYLKWKYRDVKPEEQAPLTPQERRKNWWYYHKWHLLIAALAVLFLAYTLWSVFVNREPEPDYQFAYVGEFALMDETVEALQSGLASLGEDLNGDGQVIVRLEQYTDLYSATGYAAQIRLMADAQDCGSYFFLLEDPEQFQRSFQILSRLDGSLPEDGDPTDTSLLWTQCPALTSLDLGSFTYNVGSGLLTVNNQELLSGLSIARRGFWTEKTVPYPDGCAALWELLTRDAVS